MVKAGAPERVNPAVVPAARGKDHSSVRKQVSDIYK